MGLVEQRPAFVHTVGWFELSSNAVNARSAVHYNLEHTGQCKFQQQRVVVIW